MKIKNLGSNRTEIAAGGKIVLVSYNTPVAYLESGIAYVSNHKYSKTTSKHIKEWLELHRVGPERTVPAPRYDVELVLD